MSTSAPLYPSWKTKKYFVFTGIQEKLGILNQGKVFAVFDYVSMNADELTFETNTQLSVLRKGDENEMEWWWTRRGDREGYIPRNLLGVCHTLLTYLHMY